MMLILKALTQNYSKQAGSVARTNATAQSATNTGAILFAATNDQFIQDRIEGSESASHSRADPSTNTRAFSRTVRDGKQIAHNIIRSTYL